MQKTAPVIKRRGRPKYDADPFDYQQAILAAARQVFMAQPYHWVTTGEIIQSTGVDRVLINDSFDSKAVLYQAVSNAIHASFFLK